MNAIVKLPLLGRRGAGRFALVDEGLSADLSRYKWYLTKVGYVVLARSHQGHVYLHRMVLNAQPEQFVDHINGDRLDCRLENLRFASRAENNRNVGKRGHSSQPYKGVKASGKRWKARIRYNRKEIHLGSFDTAEEAAVAYNNAASRLFGEFARKEHI